MLRRCSCSLAGLSRRGTRPYSIEVTDERWPGWQPVIGIEVHTQIRARRKLFSDGAADFEAPPNSNVSLFDAAFPGTLPVLNKACVDLGTRTALALGARVHERSSFDRKHYFYADLPAGYQITQHYSPIATGGNLRLNWKYKKTTRQSDVRIHQIQLEQDTAKSTNYPGQTFIDLNRAGAALMEIVSEPDMRSPEEAGAYVTELRALLRAIGASNGNMEEGSLRCDVNVSVHRPGEAFGTRCEIKNLNTIKGMQIAIASEIHRHIALLSAGEAVAQETRGFDEDRAETFSLRSKEDAPDYRYMPDPNLPPLILTPEYIDAISADMPPPPSEIRRQLAERYDLSENTVNGLMGLWALSDVPFDGEWRQEDAISYFQEVAEGRVGRNVANWITNTLVEGLAYRNEPFTPQRLPAEQLGMIIDLVQTQRLTNMSGKTLLRHLLAEPRSESLIDVIDRLGLWATGTTNLQEICQNVIKRLKIDPEALQERARVKMLKRLLGEVMRESGGRADVHAAEGVLREILGMPPEKDK